MNVLINMGHTFSFCVMTHCLSLLIHFRCFIEGKFDKSARPDTVLASALNRFFGNILETNTGSVHMSMKWRIQDAIGSSSNDILLDILPNLQKWLSDNTSSSENLAPRSMKGIGSSHRLKFLFCKLIGAIACRAQPLVLHLDDLQWADDMTLDIIRMMMTDPEIRHFVSRDSSYGVGPHFLWSINSKPIPTP